MNCYQALRVTSYININTTIEGFKQHCSEFYEDHIYDLTDKDTYGNTAIHAALECNNMKLFEYIIQTNPATMQDLHPGRPFGTPLYEAINKCNYRAVSILLKHKTPIDLSGHSIMKSCWNKINTTVFTLLFIHGVDVENEVGIKPYRLLEEEINRYGMEFNSLDARLETVKTNRKLYNKKIQKFYKEILYSEALKNMSTPSDIQNIILNNIHLIDLEKRRKSLLNTFKEGQDVFFPLKIFW